MAKLTVHDNLISYADGSEQILLDILSNTNENQINEVDYINNWPIYYHLSKSRQNLINWIKYPSTNMSILELGAGCGAITKALVESGNNITSVEGSIERSKIIEKRFKDFDNLTIHACEITSFEDDKKYDVVTLIGVLEYAGAYIKSNTPFEDLLDKAKSFLAEDGCLIIAIENQLGHKYLAGMPEDHYGKAYEGISGYPNYNGIKTFDKATLSNLLTKQGYIKQQWYYPFPDYKMTRILLSDNAFKKDFDYISLIETPTTDFSVDKSPIFNEREFLKILNANDIANCFMNSFLVFASPIKENRLIDTNTDIIAVKSSTFFRAAEYHAITRFTQSNNCIVVRKEQLHKNLKNENEVIMFNPSIDSINYISDAKNLADEIFDAVLSNNYQLAANYLRDWHDYLISKSIPQPNNCTKEFEGFSESYIGVNLYPGDNDNKYLPPEYLDAYPGNILFGNDDKYIRIDKEFTINCCIPAKLVYERSLLVLSYRFKKNESYISSSLNKETDIPEKLLELISDFKLSSIKDLSNSKRFGIWFYNIISTGKVIHLSMLELKDKPQTIFIKSIKQFLRPFRKLLRRIFKKLANLAFPFD